MIEVNLIVNDQEIELAEPVTIVSGSENVYLCKFTFTAEWTGFEKTAVFLSRTDAREVYIYNNECVIPWEALEIDEIKRQELKIGVYGVKDDVRMPTVYTKPLTVHPGAETADNGGTPTPTQWEQILELLSEGTVYIDPTLTTPGKGADAEVTGDLFEKTLLRRGVLSSSVTPDNVSETGYYVSSAAQTALYTGVSVFAVFLNFRTDEDGTLLQAFITTDGRIFARYGRSGDFIENIETSLSHAGKAADAKAVGDELDKTIRFRRALTTDDVLSGSNRTVTETGYYTMSIAVSQELFGVYAYGVLINFRTDSATIEQLAVFTNGESKVRYGYSEDFITVRDYTGKMFFYSSPTLTSDADDSTGGAFSFYLPYGKKHCRIKFIHATREDYDGEGNPYYHNENVYRLSECMLGDFEGNNFVSERRIWTDGAVEAAYYKDNTGSAIGTYHGWEKFKSCIVLIDGNIAASFTPESTAVPAIPFSECRKIEIFYYSDVFKLPAAGVTTETKMIDVFRHYVIDEKGIYINQTNKWLIAGNHGMFAGMGNIYRPSVNKGICDFDNVVYDVTEGVENNICGSDNAKNNVSWAEEFSSEHDVSCSIEVYPPCRFYINNLTGTANKMYFKYVKETAANETWDNEAWYTFGGSRNKKQINTTVKKAVENDIYGAYITETSAGNPATFSDGADDVPVKELIADIDTVQQGSGTASVSNPRLFVPKTSVTITHNNKAPLVIPFGTVAGDVCGGTLNVTTGELTLTHRFVEFVGGNETWGIAWSDSNPAFYNIIADAPIADSTDRGLFSLFVKDNIWSGGGNNCAEIENLPNQTRIYVRYDNMPETTTLWKQQLADWKTAGMPLQTVFRLSEPQIVQLTPTEVRTLLGGNSISADTGDVSVTYRADTGLYIEKKIAEAAE